MRAPNVDFQVLLSLIYSPGGQYAGNAGLHGVFYTRHRLIGKRLFGPVRLSLIS
jgi:hypothetical protein